MDHIQAEEAREKEEAPKRTVPPKRDWQWGLKQWTCGAPSEQRTEKDPARRSLKNAQIQGARNLEEWDVHSSTSQRRGV